MIAVRSRSCERLLSTPIKISIDMVLFIPVPYSSQTSSTETVSVHLGNRLEPLNLSQPSDSWKLRALFRTTSQRSHVEPADFSAGVDNTATLAEKGSTLCGERLSDTAEFASMEQSIQYKANVVVGRAGS